MDTTIVAVYADGGIISAAGYPGSRSPLGGVYAYCFVNAAGERVVENCGYVFPNPQTHATIPYYSFDTPTITSPVAELVALVTAMEDVQYLIARGSDVQVYSDCELALHRVFRHFSLEKVPEPLATQTRTLRKAVHTFPGDYKWGYRLLSGHPTRQDLKAGIGRGGRPVSVHNVWCDQQCGELIALYKTQGSNQP